MNRGEILRALLPCIFLFGAGQHGMAASLQYTGGPTLQNPFNGGADDPFLLNATLLDSSNITLTPTQTGFNMDAVLDVTADADGGVAIDLFAIRPAIADQAGTFHITGDISYSIWSNLDDTTASLTADGVGDPFSNFTTGYTVWSDFEGAGHVNFSEPIPFDSQTGHPAPDDAFTFSSGLGGYPLPFDVQTRLGEEFTVGIDGATAGETFRIELNESMGVDEASAAPEPATLALMGLGLLAFGSMAHKIRR